MVDWHYDCSGGNHRSNTNQNVYLTPFTTSSNLFSNFLMVELYSNSEMSLNAGG